MSDDATERLAAALRTAEEAVIRLDRTLLEHKRTAGQALYLSRQAINDEITSAYDSYHTKPDYGDAKGEGVRPRAKLVTVLPFVEADACRPDTFKVKAVRFILACAIMFPWHPKHIARTRNGRGLAAHAGMLHDDRNLFLPSSATRADKIQLKSAKPALCSRAEWCSHKCRSCLHSVLIAFTVKVKGTLTRCGFYAVDRLAP